MKRTVRYRDTSKVPEFCDVISATRNDDFINRRRQIRSRSLNRANAALKRIKTDVVNSGATLRYIEPRSANIEIQAMLVVCAILILDKLLESFSRHAAVVAAAVDSWFSPVHVTRGRHRVLSSLTP